jgi:ribonuclease BN (tRNA processing enzyme)
MKKPILLLLLLINIDVFSQSGKVIDEIKNFNNGTAVWWAGNDSWIIKSDNLVIATDLFLEEEGRIDSLPVTADELAGVLDISFITHGHGDHFNEYTSKVLLEKEWRKLETEIENIRKGNSKGDFFASISANPCPESIITILKPPWKVVGKL